MLVLIEVINQGLLYGLLAIGVMISYKILDFADLSVDGTVPLGGVVCAVLLVAKAHPLLAMLGGALAGALAGMMTGVLHVKFKLSGLLSGILVMSGLYSINLLIAGYTSNITLFNETTLFTVPEWIAHHENTELRILFRNLYTTGCLFLILVFVKLGLDWFFTTKLGFLIRVTGDNPQLVTSLGQDIGQIKIFGLMLSNAIVALFGALFVQANRTYNLSLGSGMVVIGLASVILGTSLLSKLRFLKMTSMVVIGALIYRLAIAMALQMGVPTYFEKLITVILFVATITLHRQSLGKGKTDA